MQMATYRKDKAQQTTLLKEAEACLQRAQSSEDAFLSSLSSLASFTIPPSIAPKTAASNTVCYSLCLFLFFFFFVKIF